MPHSLHPARGAPRRVLANQLQLGDVIARRMSFLTQQGAQSPHFFEQARHILPGMSDEVLVVSCRAR
jgi:hypothetical protein